MLRSAKIRPLETPRLLLRPLELADAAQIQLLFPHWEIVRYLAPLVPWPYPSDGALAYYRDAALPAMAMGKEWHWSIRLKTSPANVIGAIALINDNEHNKEGSNRGFWLGLPWHGLGLATEASEAVTAFWFDELGFSILRTHKAVANTASSRISAKNGMTLIRTADRDYVSGRLPSEIWEITAEEWRARRASDVS